MKCLKKVDTATKSVTYKRVQEGEAHLLVARDGWEYCGKQEYKRMAAEQDHG